MYIRVIDLETTGEAPPAEIVQIGSWILGNDLWHEMDQLCRIDAPAIPANISAVHHIVKGDLTDDLPSAGSALQYVLNNAGIQVKAWCAHNAKFEQQWLKPFSGDTPWICTMKCAMRAWPDAPSFSNQSLRYFLGTYDNRREYANGAHSAAPDAFVTALTLAKLREKYSIEQLIAWSSEPMQYPKINFGEHRGKPWSEVPSGYLMWMLRQATMDPDAKHCARLALKERS